MEQPGETGRYPRLGGIGASAVSRWLAGLFGGGAKAGIPCPLSGETEAFSSEKR